MIKQHKWKLLLSSILILLPVIAGLILRDALPQQMAIHWGFDGTADARSGRLFAIFTVPVSVLVVHWVCVLICFADSKNRNQNRKVVGLIFWFCPVVSLFVSGMLYAAALGMEFGIGKIIFAGVGLMFVVIGNYLPKCKQNSTIGIKVTWTLKKEENWNKTHRLAGKTWVIGGLTLMLSVFLPQGFFAVLGIMVFFVMVSLSAFYSFFYYRKQLKDGTAAETDVRRPDRKQNASVTTVLCGWSAVICVFVGILLVTGDIVIRYEDTAFTIEADYWDDVTVDYADIESIEYRERDNAGSRKNGFGSFRLQMGTFQNNEFGSYTRYSYIECDACIVLQVKDTTLVINGIDDCGSSSRLVNGYSIIYCLINKFGAAFGHIFIERAYYFCGRANSNGV